MAKSKDGHHAAYYAAMYGNLDVLKMLVEDDGDVIDLKGLNGETPLITASKIGFCNYENTNIQNAERTKYVDLCRYLLEEKNANINLEDDDGKNALQYATNPEIIGMIIEKLLQSKGTEYSKSRKIKI